MEQDPRTHAIIGAAMEVHRIVVEIKASQSLSKVDEAQLINSLVISRHNTGLLLNFGEESLR